MRDYVRGLLGPVGRKSSWQIAEHAGHDTPYGLQRLLSWCQWDPDEIRDDLQDYIAERLGRCPGSGQPSRYCRGLMIRLPGHGSRRERTKRTSRRRPSSRWGSTRWPGAAPTSASPGRGCRGADRIGRAAGGSSPTASRRHTR
ncbi:hypothetical protein ACFXPY_38415 [Streptomyces sp. NPDC059153]|uniref:hypothetical protein n=1 Tax=Streptomyces sp. NPDC059153 TaxID=3346743 RepID=UPI0036C49E4F